MAKMIQMAVTVSREKLADVLEMVAEFGGVATLSTNGINNGNGATHTTTDESDETPILNANHKIVRRVPMTTAKPVNTFRGRAVVYTPAGTQRQIDAAMNKLRSGSLSAYVYRDLVKHPGSSNADVRSRMAGVAKKIGASVESVDNIIWWQVNRGLLRKSAAE